MSDDDRTTPEETAEPADATETPEPEAAETPEPEAPKRRGVPWAKVLAFGVLPVVLVALVAAGGYLTWRHHALTTAEVAAEDSVQAARDTAVAMLTYEPAAIEEQLVAAREFLTGDFKESYTRLTDDIVIPGAKEEQISALATVPSAASVSVDGDEAVVLLFVDQTVTIGNEMPSHTKSSVRVTLENIDGQWLVSDFLPV